jgi:phosphoglycerol transferase MdoB-like AlkP superfamily enzyme
VTTSGTVLFRIALSRGGTMDLRQRPLLVELQRSILGWFVSLLILFVGLKLATIVWFFIHAVDPFSDLRIWMAPMLLAPDLFAAGTLGTALGVLGWLRRARPRLSKPVGLVMILLAGAVLLIGTANMKVIEIYRMALDWYLFRKLGDPTVMWASLVASVDAGVVLALLGGGVLLTWLPRLRWRRLQAMGPLPFLGALVVVSLLPMMVAFRQLHGRETLGLKHNALVALAMPAAPVFLYGDPHKAYDRLRLQYPGELDQLSLGQSITRARPVAGHAELRGRANGYNVVLVLLESVAAKYVDPETAPTLHALMSRSLNFCRHRTTAVNTFDAHYALFRSMPVRGDAFAMRELHGGFARDVSLMEVFHRQGYRVGMFHGSFLKFIDTRWVWEAPGVDKLLDAQEVISEKRPGWSWGAKDADLADEAVTWARQQGDGRFLMVFNPSGTHHPYLWENPARFPGDDCLGHYKSALYTVDRALERLLQGLAESGLDQRTIVVGVSDHGEFIDPAINRCGHGISLIGDELEVPFFIHHPSMSAQGRTEELPTDHWDVAPTLASLVGLPAPRQWLGRDLLARQVEPRPTFVGLDYTTHTAVVVGDVIGDLDVGSGRFTWSHLKPGQGDALQEPGADQRRQYETLLRTFDDRVVLHHASFVRSDREPARTHL